MSTMGILKKTMVAAGVGAAVMLAPVMASAKDVHIRVQAVLGTQT